MAESYIIDNPSVALTVGVPKTVVAASAGTVQPFRVIQFTVGCDATTTGLLKAEFVLGTPAGGVQASAAIARMNGESYNKAASTTAEYFTTEPTYTKIALNNAPVIKTMIFPLPSGPYDIEYPLGREFYCPTGTLLAVRLTATTVSPNAYVTLAIEE